MIQESDVEEWLAIRKGILRPIPGSDIWVHVHDVPEETRDVRSA